MQRAPQMPLQSQPLVQRARLLGEINELGSTDDAADWAHRSLRAKNTLRAADAECVEEAFAAKLVTLTDHAAEEPAIQRAASEQLTKAHLRDAHGRGRQPAAQRIDKPYLGCPNRVGCATMVAECRHRSDGKCAHPLVGKPSRFRCRRSRKRLVSPLRNPAGRRKTG